MPLTPEKHRFSVHFDVNERVFHILSGIAKHHDKTPHDVARDILLAWMVQVEKETNSVEPVKTVTEQ